MSAHWARKIEATPHALIGRHPIGVHDFAAPIHRIRQENGNPCDQPEQAPGGTSVIFLLLIAFYVVITWGLHLTRLVSLPPGLLFGWLVGPVNSILLSSAIFWLEGGPARGPICAIVSLLFSAWFAWSTRVPLFFKQFSYKRLVGTKNYRDEDVPDTVWKRPGFVERHWPTWL